MQVAENFVTSAEPAIVWKVLADVERWHEWTPTVLEIKPLGNSGMVVGARYRVVQPRLRPAVYQVTECVPDRRFTWVQRFPGAAMVADHRITQREASTEVELSFSSSGLLGNIVGKVFSRLITNYVRTEARSLKHRCESGI
ncbi:SRPBCC family protein [Occallatibacter riparius]|uniref:SRPBCC family protein n=1 Tax=Occallatibacter riparius TaxID=1002689 RepID=A0A9J7BHV0_9BACT|nr:SRPBCC family protein [Occallatibacter riparius]UWZ82027.1 SRPBCC family protein [Occallatibacter riparius]